MPLAFCLRVGNLSVDRCCVVCAATSSCGAFLCRRLPRWTRRCGTMLSIRLGPRPDSITARVCLGTGTTRRSGSSATRSARSMREWARPGSCFGEPRTSAVPSHEWISLCDVLWWVWACCWRRLDGLPIRDHSRGGEDAAADAAERRVRSSLPLLRCLALAIAPYYFLQVRAVCRACCVSRSSFCMFLSSVCCSAGQGECQGVRTGEHPFRLTLLYPC